MRRLVGLLGGTPGSAARVSLLSRRREGGSDVYGAKFARGLAEFRVRLAPDGSIDDFDFRPDGDCTSGGILTCAQEPTLKAVRDTVPVKLLLNNASAPDIRAFALDDEGR